MELPLLKLFSRRGRHSGGRILVVDDEATICKLLSDYLSRRGYEIVCATTADEALGFANALPFDLVILDLVMPNVQGFGLLEGIKSARPNLRVLVLTGVSFEEDILQEALQKGANGYLTKALPLEELLIEIHRILKTGEQPTRA